MASVAALLPTSRRPKPYELGFRRIEAKPIACRPAFNVCNAVCHPRQKLGGLFSVHMAVDLQIISASVHRKTAVFNEQNYISRVYTTRIGRNKHSVQTPGTARHKRDTGSCSVEPDVLRAAGEVGDGPVK